MTASTTSTRGPRRLVLLSPIPLIADIHFQPRYVFTAIDAGCAAVRVNPGNIKRFDDKVKEITQGRCDRGDLMTTARTTQHGWRPHVTRRRANCSYRRNWPMPRQAPRIGRALDPASFLGRATTTLRANAATVRTAWVRTA